MSGFNPPEFLWASSVCLNKFDSAAVKERCDNKVRTHALTNGHISLWRPSDRTLIAGDAVITTRQESAYAVMTQTSEMHGPPAYFTQTSIAPAIP